MDSLHPGTECSHSGIDKLNVVQPGQLFRWWILGWEGKPIDTERLITEPFVGIHMGNEGEHRYLKECCYC